jgi:hypothetical protein
MSMNDDEQLREFHASVQQIHNRFNGCLSCMHPRGDVVRARIGAFLISHWEGHQPTPPSPEELRRSCCQGGAGGYAECYTMQFSPMNLGEGRRR